MMKLSQNWGNFMCPIHKPIFCIASWTPIPIPTFMIGELQTCSCQKGCPEVTMYSLMLTLGNSYPDNYSNIRRLLQFIPWSGSTSSVHWSVSWERIVMVNTWYGSVFSTVKINTLHHYNNDSYHLVFIR